ncbi:MAG: Fur family transcriptional regulator [Anaerolineae bacterium]
MSHQHLDYAALMRQRGFRVTPQRQLILDAICEGRGHTTPEEIFERARARSSAVNRATVYRTLDFLCNLGLVVGADIGTGTMVYEIAGEQPHHHLVCQGCGRVEDIEHELVQPLFDKIEGERQFTITTNHLALFGLCSRCRPQGKR